MELTDRIIPALRPECRAGPGRPPTVTDAELVCLAVAQVLLRFNDEHHWLRAAPSRVGHLFPRLLSQPEDNRRLRGAADLLEDPLGWLADHTPATIELLRLVDGTPVPCGTSRTTARRSDLFGYAGYGRDTSHHRCYWGANLLLVVTCEGTTTGLAWPTPNWPVSVTPCWGCWTPRPTVRSRAPCWSATKGLPATRSRSPWPASS